MKKDKPFYSLFHLFRIFQERKIFSFHSHITLFFSKRKFGVFPVSLFEKEKIFLYKHFVLLNACIPKKSTNLFIIELLLVYCFLKSQNGVVMNYVFFDVECANCLNGEGKICSLGYVKTDESFTVLKKKDILMNPNAPFLLGNVKTGAGIKLAYPLHRFQQSYPFPHYYDEIKKVLLGDNTMCFGFAVHQDVSYLSYTCKRYQLPILCFPFFDIQEMEKEINHRKDFSGLDHLISEYGLDSFTYHRSDDDALMTMEVMKRLLEQENISVQDALNKYPHASSDTKALLKRNEERKKVKEQKRALHERVEHFYSLQPVKPDINLLNPYFRNKRFFFTYTVLQENINAMENVRIGIEKRGGILLKNCENASVIVTEDVHRRIQAAPAYAKYITFKELTSHLHE